jgi:hypothetical protein
VSELLEQLIDNIRNFGFESVFRRYYGVYRAQVTDNEDDEERGRIEIIVPSLFGENQKLADWAQPKDFRGAGKGRGEFFPPEIDDWVFVEFENGDPRFPIYSGGWFGKAELDSDFAYSDGKPNTRGFKTPYGHTFRMDDTEGKQKIVINTKGGNVIVLDDTSDSEAMYFFHKTGTQIQLDSKGSFKVFVTNGGFINVSAETGEVTFVSKEGATVSVLKDIKLLDSSGAHFASIDDKGILLNTSKDCIVNANTLSASVGTVSLKDTTKAGLVIKNGQVALGSAAVELVDQVIKICDALTSGAPLVTTGVGPSSPLLPPASVQLILIKTLLTTIKGSVV